MKKSFLLLDDNPINNYITESYLSEFFPGTEALSFCSPLQALAYLLEHRSMPERHPDILLLDLNMPVMNGWDFLDDFRKHGLMDSYVKMEIYILTSSIYPSDKEAAEKHELIKGYLTKPVDEESLGKLIRE